VPNLHVNEATGPISLVTTTETIVATVTPALTINAPGGEGLSISGFINVLTGTGTTAVVTRVRKGSLVTDTLIDVAQTHTIGAAVSASIPFGALDGAGASATAQNYVVTMQQTAASANGTVNYVLVNAQSGNAVE
jgi:hypothetical protein